nr:hypothetical protein [Tanacetum cinerariifolium]
EGSSGGSGDSSGGGGSGWRGDGAAREGELCGGSDRSGDRESFWVRRKKPAEKVFRRRQRGGRRRRLAGVRR